MKKNYLKFIELLLITLLSPLIIIIFGLQKFVLPLIIILSIFITLYLKKNNYPFKPIFSTNLKKLTKIIFRVLIISMFMIIYSYYFLADHFLSLPIDKFKMWVLIIILYPFLSALPQEIIFRSFFFQRYNQILNKNNLIILNGLIFGILHVIYLNLIVILIATIGGILFAKNYYCNKSLFLVTLEHSLLGIVIFSIGFGYYFNNSNIKYIYEFL